MCFFPPRGGCSLRPSAVPPASPVLQVEIRAGWKKGTRLTYTGHGDHDGGAPRRDLTFVLEEAPHPTFRRAGNDLILEHTVHLVDALSGFEFVVGRARPGGGELWLRNGNASEYMGEPCP